MTNLTLPQRIELMKEARSKGYNCAQTVVLAFPDITGLDTATAAGVTSAMGGGFGHQGELCGVIAGMAVVAGLASDRDPARKKEVYELIIALGTEFASRHEGCRRCPQLKSLNPPVACNILIEEGIEILHNRFCKQ